MPSIKIARDALPEAHQKLFDAAVDARTAYEASLRALVDVFWVSPTGKALEAMHVSQPYNRRLEDTGAKFEKAQTNKSAYFTINSVGINAANPFFEQLTSRGSPNDYIDTPVVNQLLNSKLLSDDEKRVLAHRVTYGLVGDPKGGTDDNAD